MAKNQKSASGSQRGAQKQALEKNKRVKREITGVLLIALGLFLAASLYVDAVGIVGQAASRVCFGLFGILTYALPLIVIAFGILAIASSTGNGVAGSSLVLCSLGVVCLLVLLHANVRSATNNIGLWDYYMDAYQFGSALQKGGGLIGSLLAYPALVFLGLVGTNIFFIAALLILFLVVTKISLRATGEKVGKQLKTSASNMAERAEERKHSQQSPSVLAEKIDVSKQNLFTEVMETGGRPRRGGRKTGIKVERRPVEQDAGNPQLDDLTYFPASGTLPRKPEEDDDPFDILAGVEVHTAQAPRHKSGMTVGELKAAQDASRKEKQAPPSQSQEDEDGEDAPVLPNQDVEVLEYQRPPYTLLNLPKEQFDGLDNPAENAKLLIDTLQSFHISAKIINITVGPVITRYELQPAQGVRVNRITTLSDDIALALAAPRVRIEAPIPGKSAIGIEIPNRETQPVLLREAVESPEFQQAKSPLCFALGKDIAGKVVCADLDRMPHLLIAGSTGSGKSVCINDIILSLIYHTAPCDLRMILVDPKKVELKVYSPLPHLLLPVVTDAKKAAGALKWAVREMEQRYSKMSQCNARDLNRYNSLQEDPAHRMPRLVIIIDELADLMMVAAKDVEEAICRIAQLGRAAGIHLIVATQRPSTDIITGLIKANIPSRIALTVSSAVDSRVIMDCSGAEKLLGRGDMLFHANGASKPLRAQAAFVSDEEVERVMDFFTEHATAPSTLYTDLSLEDMETELENGGPAQGNGKQEDDLLPDAVRVVMESGQASISMIQRRLRVGYARAARLVDIMEQKKIVSGFDGSKPRRLLISQAEYAEMFGNQAQGIQEDEE